jgi:transposase
VDAHAVAALDEVGRMLGYQQVAADPAGYRALLRWPRSHGVVPGVEGTGSYGAGLARFLADQGVQVVEVDGPNRKMRRQHGTSDPMVASYCPFCVCCSVVGVGVDRYS